MRARTGFFVYRELESAYQKVRKFLGPLLRVIEFGSTPAGDLGL